MRKKVSKQRTRKQGSWKLPDTLFVGMSSDGAELMAIYASRREAEEFRFADEIVCGPFRRVRAKRSPRKPRKGRRRTSAKTGQRTW